MLHQSHSHYPAIFAEFAQHDTHHHFGAIQNIPLEKSYHTPFPFSSLAANPVSINQGVTGNTYRNSFDFLEMDSTNLLEMTGDIYQRLYNQNPLPAITVHNHPVGLNVRP